MASPQHFQDAAKDFAVVSAPQADLHAADAELDSAVPGTSFRISLDLLRNNLYHSDRAIRMPVRFCLFRLDDLTGFVFGFKLPYPVLNRPFRLPDQFTVLRNGEAATPLLPELLFPKMSAVSLHAGLLSIFR